MTGASCGCAKQPCDCCTGVTKLTPATIYNRPGLPALRYRAGTHGSFLQTMKARLSTMAVERTAQDGTPLEPVRPLRDLTTRAPSDPSIALLDAWASAADVLTFYTERVANECYLPTATERLSVLELSRLIGYKLRPGVASTAYLAYTLDDNQAEPVTIAPGARSQSIPGPDETPQSFETSDPLIARREWSNLQVRLKRPQGITLANALSISSLHVAGVATGLKSGDKLLLLFSEDGTSAVIRTVASIDAKFDDQRTAIALKPVKAAIAASVPYLVTANALLELIANADPDTGAGDARRTGLRLLRTVQLGGISDPSLWADDMAELGEGHVSGAALSATNALKAAIAAELERLETPSAPVITSPREFAQKLLVPPIPQARNALQLRRTLSQAFGVGSFVGSDSLPREYSDVSTQLVVGLEPRLKDSYYKAWSGALLNDAPAPLLGVHVLRSRATLFGATAAKIVTYERIETRPTGVINPPSAWDEWTYEEDEHNDNAFLDQGIDAIAPGSYALIDVGGNRRVWRVAEAATTPRAAYNVAGPSTRVHFELNGTKGWRNVNSKQEITNLRKTQLYVNSEPLALVEMPIEDAVSGQEIELAALHRELTSGRWVIVSGERADIEGVSGVRTAELMMISGLRHGFDDTLAGDTVHTTLLLATPLAHAYKRATLTIFGNVVKATHGETRNEPLGSGNGAQSMQTFALKQPPLTFIAAPTAKGAESTLQVRVNDVLWHETDSLAWLGPKDRGFITHTDDAGNTSVTFGNGVHGARVPSGVQNIVARYRNGIGSPGNVRAEQISLLQTRPLGVKAVINPLRTSGGADKESRDLARETAPLSVMPFDRLVSIPDYASFSRCFAGIAKASALQASDGQRQLIQVTIAGTNDVPIDRDSDLYVSLVTALRELGDADLPLRVDVRERVALVLGANVALQPDYAWEPVVSAVRARLLERFGFAKRSLGQPALLCEVIAAIQSVPGVAYVDIDSFGGVPEMVDDYVFEADGTPQPTRRLLNQDDVALAIKEILATPAGSGTRRLPPDVLVWPGGADENGLLRPAELAAFLPEVSDTLILNQIL